VKNKLNLLLALLLLSGFGLACKFSEAKSEVSEIETKTEKRETKSEIERLDGYTMRGIEFVYYKIPAGLSREDLIATAQKLHEKEPKAQLILVDDAEKVRDYIDYAKAVSVGNYDAAMPKEWADAHVVANVQKLLSGKFVLYEGYGYREIAELK
jgi:alanyl-tRNA synthetase